MAIHRTGRVFQVVVTNCQTKKKTKPIFYSTAEEAKVMAGSLAETMSLDETMDARDIEIKDHTTNKFRQIDIYRDCERVFSIRATQRWI